MSPTTARSDTFPVDDVASRTDALLCGRRTWEVMAGAWPERAGDSFADWINAAPKYVVSSTLDPHEITWQPTTVIRPDDLATAVGDRRNEPGRDVNVMGAARVHIESAVTAKTGVQICRYVRAG